MCISSDAAVVAVTPDTSEGARRCHRSVWTLLRDYRMLAHDDGEGRPLRYLSWYGGIVWTLLHDDRMLAHDDGEGRPLRYLSWYGGIVTSML